MVRGKDQASGSLTMWPSAPMGTGAGRVLEINERRAATALKRLRRSWRRLNLRGQMVIHGCDTKSVSSTFTVRIRILSRAK